MASPAAESSDDSWIRLEEVQESADSHAMLVLVVVCISLSVPCLGVVLIGFAGWLLGMEMERWSGDVRKFFVICGVVAGATALLFLCGLCRRWIQRQRSGKFLGPLDVRLCGPIVVGEPFSIHMKQPVRRPVDIERLDVSLICVEETRGTGVSPDGHSWPFIDERELSSQTRHFGLEARFEPTGAAPEAMAEFAIPDEIRTLLGERRQIAGERIKETNHEGNIRIDDRVIRWLIRIEVVVVGSTVRQAVFLLPSQSVGGFPRDDSH